MNKDQLNKLKKKKEDEKIIKNQIKECNIIIKLFNIIDYKNKGIS